MSGDEISDLRLFAKIVSAGSLSEAARRLPSSLPSVSRRLAAMEARLGVRLIDRGTRHFALTAEGKLYLEAGASVLEDLDTLEGRLRTRTAEAVGHVRVGAPNQIGRHRIAPLIAAFANRNPKVIIDLVLSDDRLDVIGDKLDLCLHIDEPRDSSAVVRKLLSSRRAVCAAPAYLEAQGVPKSPVDLEHHACLRLMRGYRVFDTWPFIVNGFRCDVQVKGPLLSNSAEVLYGWALAGQGLVFKAVWDVSLDLEEGRLVECLKPFAVDELNLYVVYASKRHLPLRVRLLIDSLCDTLR